MDQIHEAFVELSTLGIITESNADTVTLNRKALYSLGYILISSINVPMPVFTTILNFNYMYNPMVFIGNVIPKRALSSFVLAKIQTVGLSPK